MGHVTITTPLLGWFLICLVRLDIAYLCTQFDSSSLSHSLDMDGGLKFKMGHVMSPRPCQGRFVLGWLGLATINLCTKFEISMFTHYKGMKGNEKCKNLGDVGG